MRDVTNLIVVIFPRLLFLSAMAGDGGEPNQRTKDESLWAAAKEGKVKDVETWASKGANPNWRNPWEPLGRANQFTALHIAADQGHVRGSFLAPSVVLPESLIRNACVMRR